MSVNSFSRPSGVGTQSGEVDFVFIAGFSSDIAKGVTCHRGIAAKCEEYDFSMRLLHVRLTIWSRDQLDFISISLSSSVFSLKSSVGRKLRSGKGNNELRLHRIMSAAKWSNLSLVTPKTWVNPAPISPPKTLPAFDIDINVANRVASTPSGHNFAAKTRIGIKEIWNTETCQLRPYIFS